MRIPFRGGSLDGDAKDMATAPPVYIHSLPPKISTVGQLLSGHIPSMHPRSDVEKYILKRDPEGILEYFFAGWGEV